MKSEMNTNSIMDSYEICPICQCCNTDWEECWNCGGEGGRDWEDLQFEDPLWYDEDSFEKCHVCDGEGGWQRCLGNCDDNGSHTNG